MYRRCCRVSPSTYKELEQLDDEELSFKKLIIESGGTSSDFNPFGVNNDDEDTTIEDGYSQIDGSHNDEGDDEESADNVFELNSSDQSTLNQLETLRNNLMMASNADVSLESALPADQSIESMRL